ncbi:MAG: hypothetical protein WA461_01030 [Nitrososphaeraceae archaeon]
MNWTRSEKFESHDPYEPEDKDRHRDACSVKGDRLRSKSTVAFSK